MAIYAGQKLITKGVVVIEGGGESGSVSLQSKNVTPKSSAQVVIPDAGYQGLSKVTVGAVPTEEKTVDSTGVFQPSSGKFFSKVTVDIPVYGENDIYFLED